jgi:uncharacterized protein YqgC (DUF456 family)
MEASARLLANWFHNISFETMTVEQIVGLSIALFVMFTGSVASIVPGIPGTPIVLIVAILHRLYFHAASINNWVLAGLVLLTLLSIFLDYIASMVGAKKMGATWRGIVGAVVGGLIGMFFGFVGIIIGPFLGAVLFELVGGHKFKAAAKAGFGAMIGLVAGAVGKFAICVLMMSLFAVDVIIRS